MIVRAAAKPKQVNRYARFLAGQQRRQVLLRPGRCPESGLPRTHQPAVPAGDLRDVPESSLLRSGRHTPEWCGTTRLQS